MALDQEYFDAIHIDVVKKKYYNAGKVEAVLEDIRQQAAALTEENRRLHDLLETGDGVMAEAEATLHDARLAAQKILDRAKQQAALLLTQAQAEAQRQQQLSTARQDLAVRQVTDCLSRVRQMQLDAIEDLDAQWRALLCGLYPVDGAPCLGESLPDTAPGAPLAFTDLSDKIDAIARELQAIGAPGKPFDPHTAEPV